MFFKPIPSLCNTNIWNLFLLLGFRGNYFNLGCGGLLIQVFISPNAGAVASGGFFDYETDVRRTMNLRLVATDRVRETTQRCYFSIVF